MTDIRDITDAVSAGAARTVARLEELVRVPSISADGHDQTTLDASADLTARQLRDAGLTDVEAITAAGSPPYVIGSWLEAAGAPTVLLYAHHDVQPVPAADTWTTPPFQPSQRDGRLYARGASDDKGGIAVHVAAIDAWMRTRGTLPLNVKVIVEGEEEVGSPHMAAFLAEYGERLRADVVVVCDSGNWDTGKPAITYSTRGLAEVFVTVRALKAAVHSGWSGPMPDALSGLIVALASLKDERGGSAVAGLADDARVLPAAERELMRVLESEGPSQIAAMLPGVEVVGDPGRPVLEKMWSQPAITVIGLDVPSVREATNQLVSEARAKVSIRLAPGQDPQRAADLVAEHLRQHVPWGLRAETEIGALAHGWVTEPDGPAFDAARSALAAAFGREPALVGIGGTLPLLTLLDDTLNRAPCLLTAVGDPRCRAHGTDESVDLGDLERASLAEALLFRELAR